MKKEKNVLKCINQENNFNPIFFSYDTTKEKKRAQYHQILLHTYSQAIADQSRA